MPLPDPKQSKRKEPRKDEHAIPCEEQPQPPNGKPVKGDAERQDDRRIERFRER